MERRTRRPPIAVPAAIVSGALAFVAWAPPLPGFAVAILAAAFWCVWLEDSA